MSMTIGVTLDCPDLVAGAEFWRGALGYDEPVAVDPEAQFNALVSPGGGLHHLTLQRVSEPKTVKNRAHLDLFVDDLSAEVARLSELGGSVAAEHDASDGGFATTVMTDPAGNEFCVVQRR